MPLVRLLTAVSLALVVGTPVAAQDQRAIAAWFAMMATPFGALPPVVTPRMLAGVPSARQARSSFELSYGRFAFGGEAPVHSLGVGGHFGGLGLVAARQNCSGCDGSLLLAVTFEGTVGQQVMINPGSSSVVALGIQPMLGYGQTRGRDGATALSATVDFPLSIATEVGSGAQIVPWLAAGYGYGRLNEDAGSQWGTRASAAVGIGLIHTATGLGLNAGWRKVLLDGTPSTRGLSVSFSR